MAEGEAERKTREKFPLGHLVKITRCSTKPSLGVLNKQSTFVSYSLSGPQKFAPTKRLNVESFNRGRGGEFPPIKLRLHPTKASSLLGGGLSGPRLTAWLLLSSKASKQTQQRCQKGQAMGKPSEDCFQLIYSHRRGGWGRSFKFSHRSEAFFCSSANTVGRKPFSPIKRISNNWRAKRCNAWNWLFTLRSHCLNNWELQSDRGWGICPSSWLLVPIAELSRASSCDAHNKTIMTLMLVKAGENAHCTTWNCDILQLSWAPKSFSQL